MKTEKIIIKKKTHDGDLEEEDDTTFYMEWSFYSSYAGVCSRPNDQKGIR